MFFAEISRPSYSITNREGRAKSHYASFVEFSLLKEQTRVWLKHTYLPQELSRPKRRKSLVEAFPLHIGTAETSGESKAGSLKWVIFLLGLSVRARSFLSTLKKRAVVSMLDLTLCGTEGLGSIHLLLVKM